jgi:hypothetical protein
MSQVIPGTDLVTSPGVLNGFQQYLADKEARATARAAAAEALGTVEQAQAEAKTKVTKVKAVKEAKQPKTNDKKVAAQKIFESNKDKGNGEIAKLIASELEITYANAYYYVTRVFR